MKKLNISPKKRKALKIILITLISLLLVVLLLAVSAFAYYKSKLKLIQHPEDIVDYTDDVDDANGANGANGAISLEIPTRSSYVVAYTAFLSSVISLPQNLLRARLMYQFDRSSVTKSWMALTVFM